MLSPLGWAVVAANLVIVAGYVGVAVAVAPNFRSTHGHARVGGVFFFLLCAFTHLEMVAHAVLGVPLGRDDWGSWHMALIHVPQAVAVSVFIAGLVAVGLLGPQPAQRGPVVDALARVGELRVVLWLVRVLDRRVTLWAVLLGVAVLVTGSLNL